MTDETFDSRTDTARLGHPSRRTLLRGAAIAGVAVPFLAACASGGSSNQASGTPNGNGGGAANGGNQAGGGGGSDAIATTSQVPEGGGLILDKDGLVITQPTAGEFKGFSNICTHAGCPVDNVSNGTINCICHGSMFSITDGSVRGGPAPAPLPEKAITVTGKNITLG